MRTKHVFSIGTLLASSAFAQVHINDVLLTSDPWGQGATTYLQSLSAGGQGACGFSLASVDNGGLSSRISAFNIAEAYSLFVVTEGTAFDAEYVLSHAAVVNNAGTLPSYTIPFDGQPLFFAYWDDRAFFGGNGAWGEVDNSDLFGWMHVAFSLGTDPDTLQPAVVWSLLDSATASGGGIIVGTYTQIPESSSAACFLGIVVFATAAICRRPLRVT